MDILTVTPPTHVKQEMATNNNNNNNPHFENRLCDLNAD